MERKVAPESYEEMKAMDLMAKKQQEHDLTVQQIEEMYGGGQPYERIRLENEIRFYQEHMGESLMEIGKRLVLMKAREGHGGFLKVLENINMTPRSAQFAMTAARKFSNTKSISHLGTTKMIALSVLDDDEIKEIDDIGVYADKTIDEIEKMSVSELKKLVRKERTDRAADKETSEKRLKAIESVIKAKEEKLTELELEVANRLPPTKTELAQLALDDLRRDYMEAILHAGYEVRSALEVITKAQAIENVNFTQLQEFVHQYDEHYAILCERRDTLEDAINNACPDKKE